MKGGLNRELHAKHNMRLIELTVSRCYTCVQRNEMSLKTGKLRYCIKLISWKMMINVFLIFLAQWHTAYPVVQLGSRMIYQFLIVVIDILDL